jgi:hypothetical protein
MYFLSLAWSLAISLANFAAASLFGTLSVSWSFFSCSWTAILALVLATSFSYLFWHSF